MSGYSVSDGWLPVSLRAILERHAPVEFVALASLDEEHLGFTGQRGTSLGGEVTPDGFRLVRGVVGVQQAKLTVAQHRDYQAVVLRVIHVRD